MLYLQEKVDDMTDPSDLGSTLWSLSVTEVKEDNTVAAHPITIAAHPITIAAHPITIAAQTYITWICLNLLHEGIIWANSPGSVQTAATIVLLLGFLCFWVFWKVENMPVILKKIMQKKSNTKKLQPIGKQSVNFLVENRTKSTKSTKYNKFGDQESEKFVSKMLH